MLEKYPKFVLFLILFCLIGAGAFYFSNIWKGEKTQTQTAQNLVLLTSHSQPEAGDEWIVSFETIGLADLTITPTDQDSIDDLDFVCLTCDGKEKIEDESLRILEGDVVFYSNWQCDGRGEIIHLVNIARKHTLKFQFKDKMAFAYNNPDSVTDTFDNEDYIASSGNITVSGGQVYLSTCGDNGVACSAGGECCSGNCVDDVCCNNECTGSTCQRCDDYSNAGAGTCGYVSSSSEDPDSECPGAFGTCAATTCSGSASSCGYLSGQQGCATCTYCNGSSYDCTNYAIDTQPTGCTGCNYCNGSGSCLSCSYTYVVLQSFCISTTPTLYCKPSTTGNMAYDASGCSGNSWSAGQQTDKCQRYECGCD